MNLKIFFTPYKEIKKIQKLKINNYKKAEILASISRLNTFAMIKFKKKLCFKICINLLITF